MSLTDHAKTIIDEFFVAIAPIQAAYLDPSFTYLAIRRPKGSGFTLVTARVSFNNGKISDTDADAATNPARSISFPFREFESTKCFASHP